MNRLYFIAFVFCSGFLFSQGTNHVNRAESAHWWQWMELQQGVFSDSLHTNIGFYNAEDIANYIVDHSLDSLYGHYFPTEISHHGKWREELNVPGQKPLWNTFYDNRDDFYYKKLKNSWIAVNPIVDAQYTFVDENESSFKSRKGLQIEASIDDKLSLFSYMTDNQWDMPQYFDYYYSYRNAIPYEGRYQLSESSLSDEGVFDFFSAQGYLSFQVLPSVKIQAGHGKTFVGSGIRSMVLSDFSNSYPFLSFSTSVGKLHYYNLFALMTNQFEGLNDGLKERKFLAFHQLSYDINHKWRIGVFESTMSYRENQRYDISYLNPVIFYRWVEHNLGSPDNVMVGWQIDGMLKKGWSVYHQMVFDEFNFEAVKENNGDWRNKYALQFGTKFAYNIAQRPSLTQLEFNLARPFIYAHREEQVNFTNYNLPIAHPVGANFREVVVKHHTKIHPKIEVKIIGYVIDQGVNSTEDSINYGGDIFADPTDRTSDINQELLQGLDFRKIGLVGTVTYEIKPNVKLNGYCRYDRYDSYYWKPNSYITSSISAGIGIQWNAWAEDYIF